jgi:hypothetical protein
MSKPTWDEAPEWANWLARDEDGTWGWFENEPRIRFNDGWYSDSGRYLTVENYDYWRDTLEPRP